VTEQELVALAKQGDCDAFGQLIIQNQNRIYSLALRMVRHPEDALDLSQESFLNAWKGLKQFKGDSSFATWLYRLASNACIDYLRRQKKRQALEQAVSLDDDSPTQAHIPALTFNPQDELERKELRQTLEDALWHLSAEHRQVLILRELDGLSYQEIGDLLSLQVGTVKSRIARARVSLRNQLLQQGNFLPGGASISIEKKERE